MRGGASHLCSSRALRQRRAHHPLHMHLQCCRMHAHRCNIVHRWQATRRWTSRMKSTAVMVGKIAAPPLSATTRGVEILKVAASRKTSTHMHQCVGVQSHMRHTPNSPGVWGGGVHGACPTSAYGGLVTQVSAPPTREVRRDGQLHRIPADLLHLHPRSRGVMRLPWPTTFL
jgi:hypothetical protein